MVTLAKSTEVIVKREIVRRALQSALAYTTNNRLLAESGHPCWPPLPDTIRELRAAMAEVTQ